MAKYTIEWVNPVPREHGEGTLKTYYFETLGEFEGEKKKASIGRKSVSDAPKVGEEMEGHFELNAKGYENFVRAKPPFGGSAGTTAGSFQGKSPDDRASIERQVAVKAATEVQCAYIAAKKPLDSKEYIALFNLNLALIRGDIAAASVVQPHEEEQPIADTGIAAKLASDPRFHSDEDLNDTFGLEQ